MKTSALTPELLDKMDAYLRAANFVEREVATPAVVKLVNHYTVLTGEHERGADGKGFVTATE